MNPAETEVPNNATPAPASGFTLNESVHPGDDFYAYVNDAWIAEHPIPADKQYYATFTEMRDGVDDDLRALLEDAAAAPESADRNTTLLGQFYRSGMDTGTVDREGLDGLSDLLAKIDAIDSRSGLANVTIVLLDRGFSPVYYYWAGVNPEDSTVMVPALYQGGLGLPDRDYYLKDDAKSKEIREKYLAHVARMLELLGDAPDAAKAKAATVMALETKLATAARTRVELRDPERNYNRKSVAELAAEAPGYDWAAYFEALGIAGLKELNVRQPGFAKEFAALASSEPLDAWKAYFRWHLVRASADALPKRFEEEAFAFYGRTLNGVPQQEERWKRVQAATDRALGEALGQIYVERAFSPKSKERMKVLVENLRASLKERIAALPWMGEETKKAAQKKLAAFGVKIGYPDTWRDYSALEVSRGSYFENVVAANAFEAKRNLGKLGRPIDRTEWGMTPPTVNAYYSPTMNEIVFPAGILQPPFFWADGDDAVNYGGIGVVIGHEMTHGFDDSGSRYDADGNLKNWWTEEDRKAYESRTALVVKQFDGYRPLADQAINGKLTLGENVSDLGGLKVAYEALRKALGKDPNEAEKVEGFTPAQRFFLNYASVWRNNIRDEALRVRLNTDSHSPGRFRVLGPLSALPEFHAAFGCAAGSAMVMPEAERPSIF